MVEAVEVIRRVYEGFDRGDLSPLLVPLDPQVKWNEAEHVTFWPGTAFHGPEAIVEGLFARIPPTFGRTWTVHVDRLLACGDNDHVRRLVEEALFHADHILQGHPAHHEQPNHRRATKRGRLA